MEAGVSAVQGSREEINMIRVLDMHFARSISLGVLASTMLFAGLFFFLFFIKELRYVGTAEYDIAMAFVYVMLSLPQQLYELAPSIILIGSLMALGSLADHSEIIVIRAAGLSTMSITAMVMNTGLIIAVMVGLAGEYVIPQATSLGESMRVQALNERFIAGSEGGIWSRDDKRYINIGLVRPDKQLHRVGIYDTDADGRLTSVTSVGWAEQVAEGWKLHDVAETRISEQGVTSTRVDSRIVARLIDPGLFDVLKTEPENMSATALYRYSNYLEANELDAEQFRLQFWVKVFTPLTCLVMILIALPLVLNSSARTGGAGQRIVIGLGIGVLFFIFNRMVGYMGLSIGLLPVLSAALPPLLAAAALVYLLKRY